MIKLNNKFDKTQSNHNQSTFIHVSKQYVWNLIGASPRMREVILFLIWMWLLIFYLILFNLISHLLNLDHENLKMQQWLCPYWLHLRRLQNATTYLSWQLTIIQWILFDKTFIETYNRICEVRVIHALTISTP